MVARPPDDQSLVDSTATLASLYQAPLGEFTARRAALVAQLKRSGHKEVAARIAAAVKPSRAAHLVNQVFWRARAVYDAVLDAGTAARAAQQARLLGDTATDLNETLRDRDAAVRAAVEMAVGAAFTAGQGASDAVAAQLRASFEALAAHGLEGRLAHGHLTADVALPGLAAFAGLVLPAPTGSPEPVRRFDVVARRPEPVSPSASVPPDPRIAETEASIARLRERRAEASERCEALRRGTAAAQEVAMHAEQEAADAARKAIEARRAVERAEASRLAAEHALQRVDDELSGAVAQLHALQFRPR
jgi:hypothetical protein